MLHLRKLVFLYLLVFSITGCRVQQKEKKYSIGFSQINSEDNWRKAMNQSMKIESDLHPNIELKIVNAASNVDKQIGDVEKFIEDKVDAIIISPIAPIPLKAVLNKAVESKIPVIILDRKVDAVNYSSFIGADNYEVGQNSAKYICSVTKTSNIIEIKGWAGTTPTIQRSKGFNEIIDTKPQQKIIAVVQDRYDNPGIKERFKKALLKNPTTDVVFAHNDALALQAYEVAKELGKENKIQFFGVEGVKAPNGGMDLVERKILKSTTLYPTGGKEAIRTAIKILNNEKVERNYVLPSVIIDKENVQVLKKQAELLNEQELDIQNQQENINQQVKLYNEQSQFLLATLLFLGVTLLSLFIAYQYAQKLKKQKKTLEEQKKQISTQKQKIEKIAEDLRITNEATTNFFTGVSHDFKTPITLILSSTESLLSSSVKTKPEEFGLIYNNSKRLLRLVNQLLDFRRIDSGKFKLKASKTNIFSFVDSIYKDFKTEAQKNAIDFTINTNTKDVDVYLDRDLFDNVLFNLLSNAFKFTSLNGTISINIQEQDNEVSISVKDSGIGILSEEKEKVFNQFFQGSNNKQTSSGIGLFLTREFVKLHSGRVEVVSSEGKGAEFKVIIPKGKAHLQPREIIISDETTLNETIDVSSMSFENSFTKESLNEDDKNTLLIIEDNTDLRTFIKNKLSHRYKVFESDGIDAIDKALEIIPDIIISDVNLPDKNGFEICEVLKNDKRTSHIPIIILTALSTSDAHLQGLKVGADMFLTKPFNFSVLHQSLESLLYNRAKIQQFYNENFVDVKKDIVEEKKSKSRKGKSQKKKDLEKQFLEDINSIVSKNLDDSTFSVEVLAEELSISRVQLYRKVKAVLGISISDYIQNIRLDKSKELLKDKKLTIADIAYSTGFSSPNYFSTAFKNKFGDTPNAFRK